jgi:glycine/D-amino acid oxidase-like deaminating enzyme
VTEDIFAADFTDRPFWLSPAPVAKTPVQSLPAETDILIVGAGLTGLSAGHDLARAGRSVLIVDAEEPGEGASSRNAGMLGRNTKHSFLGLSKAMGQDAAIRYFRTLHTVFQSSIQRIRDEGIECDYQQHGRIVVAHTPDQFARLRSEYEARAKHLGEAITILDKGLDGEVGSPEFVGGVHVQDNAAVHAGRYTRAFVARARAAGSTVAAHVAVTGIRREGTKFTVDTSRGRVRAGEVLLCTNGYTAKVVPWITRRLIQIESYIVTTEPLPAEIVASIFPRNRTYIDSTRRPMSMRLSPDGTRILFGARTGEPKSRTLRQTARVIHNDLVCVFPQLRGFRLSHAWGGRCGVTWDHFPHVGQHDGMHYALGYNFSGLAMAPYLGGILARQVLGAPRDSDFQTRKFPGVVMPARAFDNAATGMVIRYYGWRDHASMRRTS